MVVTESVLTQVERVIRSEPFARSNRLKDFLKFVVSETLSGRGRDIKAYTVGLAVFRRSNDFDPAQDAIVRVEAQRLRHALERYYLTEGKNDPIRIDLPKGRYVAVFTEGPAQPLSGPATERPVQRPDEPRRIAVLPFKNLSGDSGQDYLADGFTEELIVLFGKCRDLEVLSRYALAYQQIQGTPPRELCSRLGLRFILEGSVRRDERFVSVTARLNDTGSGRQVWAEKFERHLATEKVLGMQEEIAQSVVTCVTKHCNGAINYDN